MTARTQPRRFRRTRIAIASLLVILVTIGGLLQLPPVGTWLARRLLSLVPLNDGYHLKVDRVSGDWFGGLNLEGLVLTKGEQDLARVDTVRARYRIRDLLGTPISLEQVGLAGVRVSATRQGKSWDLAEAIRPSPNSDSSAGKGVRVGTIDVRDVMGTAAFAPDSVARLRGLTARILGLETGKLVKAHVQQLNLALAPPSSSTWFAISLRGEASDDFYRFDPVRIQTERTTIGGRLVVPRSLGNEALLDSLDVRLRASPLALADLESMVPSVRREGRLELDLTAGAKGGVIMGRLAAGIGAGKLVVNGTTPMENGRPQALRMNGTLSKLDPSAVTTTAPKGDVNGALTADLRGALDTATGSVDLRVDGSRVGGTKLGRLTGHADVAAGRAEIKLEGEVNAIMIALAGWVRPFDSIPTYGLAGTANRLPGTAAATRMLTGTESDSVLEVRFRVQGRGISVATADLSGRIDLASLGRSSQRMSLGHATFTLASSRLNAEPEIRIGGGQISARAVATLGDTIAYRVTGGTIRNVDLARLMKDSTAGPIDGQFSLTGSGTAPEEAVAHAVLRVDSINYGGRRLDSLAVRTQLRRGRADGRVQAVVERGRLAADFVAHPFDSMSVVQVNSGRVDALDLQSLLGDSGVRSNLNATFTATIARAGHEATRFVLQLLPSSLNDVSLTSGGMSVALENKQVDGRLSLKSEDGVVNAAVSGTMDSAATAMRLQGGWRLEHLAKWIGRKDLREGRLEGEFALDAALDSAGLRSVGGTASAQGALGEARLRSARVLLTPMNGGVRVDSLDIVSNVARFRGGGTVALRRSAPPGLLRVNARVGDLSALASLTGDTISMDSASAVMQLAGPAQAWRFSARGQAHRILYGDKLAERATILAAGTIDSAGLGGVRGELHVDDAAVGTISVPSVHAIARYDSVVALDAEMRIADSVRLATKVRGRVSGDTVRATLTRLDLAEGGRTWGLTRPAGLELGPRVVVQGLDLRAGDRRITAAGVYDVHDSSDVALTISKLDLDAFRSVGLTPIGGQLDGTIRLVGTAESPTLLGQMGLTIVDSARKIAGRVQTGVRWNRTGLFLDAEAAPSAGGKVTISGMLPYRFTLAPKDTASSVGVERGTVDTLGLRIKADSFNLALFQPLLPPDVATDLAGILIANGTIRGRLDAPDARGRLQLRQAGVTLPTLGVSYQDGELSGRVEGEDLRIERLRLTTGKKQELTAHGIVHLNPLNDPGLELSAKLNDFLVSNSSTLRSSASGRLQLTGSANKPSVTGALTLGPTDVYVGAGGAAGKVEPVELSPDELRKLARDFGPAVLAKARTEETPGLMSRLHMDIQLRVPRRVWIRKTSSPEANIELAGQMRLVQQPGGDMQFIGKVSPVPGRGTLDLSGRTFRLTGGDIFLNGPVDSTRLDVNAEYQVPTQGGGEDDGVLITVAAKGRLDSLGLEFSSEPSMSREDVLSYIVTGHPASDNSLLEGGGGGGASGKQIALGQLSQAISGAAGRSLGFDVFQIKQEGTSGFNLTAGRYLSDRLFLNLKLPLGGNTSTDPGQNLGLGFELEYTLQRWLRADLRGGSLPPAFVFRGRHAY